MENTALITTAKTILSANPNALLSGSLALTLQGIKTRRKPTDIDIYLPYGETFATDGLKKVNNENDEDYENEYYERSGFRVSLIDIDVFTPIHENITPLNKNYCFTNRISLVDKHDIIAFKMHHALAGGSSAFKHKFDLIHILANH